MNYKKMSCVFFLLISNLSFAHNVDSNCHMTQEEICSFSDTNSILTEEKVYLSQEDICLENKQMFAKVKGQWIPMNQLHCDSSGYYVNTSDAKLSFWTCDRCGKVNYPWSFACENCGNAK